jgi:hypothetical protein
MGCRMAGTIIGNLVVIFFGFEIHASAYLAIFIACTIALHSESIIT